MLKRCKVVLLPTNNEGLIQSVNGELFLADKLVKSCGIQISNHFYVLSDDEIKVGDWTLTNPKGNNESRPFKVDNGGTCTSIEYANERYKSYNYLKVIASTDPSLNLPSPSKAFIQKYCNKGGIDEVMVDLFVDLKTCEDWEYLRSAHSPFQCAWAGGPMGAIGCNFVRVLPVQTDSQDCTVGQNLSRP